ncbi:hypothetical protein Axi01nite_25960 [Actinoplanes xinjiangensis]|nr:hypothetical protein Axi01nite_25960 [Actinoplanes xinjiangensis]
MRCISVFWAVKSVSGQLGEGAGFWRGEALGSTANPAAGGSGAAGSRRVAGRDVVARKFEAACDGVSGRRRGAVLCGIAVDGSIGRAVCAVEWECGSKTNQGATCECVADYQESVADGLSASVAPLWNFID